MTASLEERALWQRETVVLARTTDRSEFGGKALKYTPPGGTVWLRSAQEGSEVVLHMEDTGFGIALEVLPKDFDLFTCHKTAMETEPAGFGIRHGDGEERRAPARWIRAGTQW